MVGAALGLLRSPRAAARWGESHILKPATWHGLCTALCHYAARDLQPGEGGCTACRGLGFSHA